jgi:putative membrane protein
MTTSFGRHCLLGLSAATLLVACKPKGNYATDTTSSAGAVATGSDSANRAAAATDTTANRTGSWTDGQIFAFASAANNGEIAEGKLAQTRATNAKVKAFARQMVTDHQAMLNELKTFAKNHNITADSTRNDVTDLTKDARDELKDLTDKAKGADWDKDFMDKEIDGHKKVLDKLQEAERSTTNPQFKEMLTKAIGKVQEHLTKAQDIKDNTLKS